MDYDGIADGFGIALGLGEEIALAERAREMSQEEDGVLGPPVSETNLVPLSTPREYNLVDLTDAKNWLIPLSKKLKSPFIEKWRRVALGLKDPDTPLLTHEESSAYQIALRAPEIDGGLDKEVKEVTANIQKLKKLHLQSKMKTIFKEIKKRRCSHGNDQNHGQERV